MKGNIFKRGFWERRKALISDPERCAFVNPKLGFRSSPSEMGALSSLCLCHPAHKLRERVVTQLQRQCEGPIWPLCAGQVVQKDLSPSAATHEGSKRVSPPPSKPAVGTERTAASTALQPGSPSHSLICYWWGKLMTQRDDDLSAWFGQMMTCLQLAPHLHHSGFVSQHD